MKNITTVIRIILSAILLFIVWHNAHWSVALCLILLCIFAEQVNYAFNNNKK